MKCSKCGHEFEGKFCPECGTPAFAAPATSTVPTMPAITPRPKKKGKGCLIVVCVFVILAALGALFGGEESGADSSNTVSSPASVSPSSVPAASSDDSSSSAPASSQPDLFAGETVAQKNARNSAESYLSFSAFSYNGLIEQLEYEGYTTEEATYAADNCGADWNEQAAKSAESYLDMMSFSRQGLIEQLEYEGFTREQAEYGATQNGL